MLAYAAHLFESLNFKKHDRYNNNKTSTDQRDQNGAPNQSHRKATKYDRW